jgi:hypothetical protein
VPLPLVDAERQRDLRLAKFRGLVAQKHLKELETVFK